MLAARTELRNAQKVKQHLAEKNLFHPDLLAVKEFNYIYFPLARRARIPHAKVVNVRFSFPRKRKDPTVEELLRHQLTKKELALLPKAQESIGTIMILEIPDELRKKEALIARAYLQQNKSITTVVKKDRAHAGEFRLRKVKILAGKQTKETIHRENGVRIKLNIENTYFSARLASERLRIAKQVKPGEDVLVMFSGAAPYPLAIAKHSPARHVYGIELNPSAHQYALENLKLNNLQHRITILEGDVRVLVPRLKRMFNRMVMPLPKTGEMFLDTALGAAKKGAFIHLYAFLREEEIVPEKKKIKEICAALHHPVKILRTVHCGQFSPYVHRVCFDLRVLK